MMHGLEDYDIDCFELATLREIANYHAIRSKIKPTNSTTKRHEEYARYLRGLYNLLTKDRHECR